MSAGSGPPTVSVSGQHSPPSLSPTAINPVYKPTSETCLMDSNPSPEDIDQPENEHITLSYNASKRCVVNTYTITCIIHTDTVIL